MIKTEEKGVKMRRRNYPKLVSVNSDLHMCRSFTIATNRNFSEQTSTSPQVFNQSLMCSFSHLVSFVSWRQAVMLQVLPHKQTSALLTTTAVTCCDRSVSWDFPTLSHSTPSTALTLRMDRDLLGSIAKVTAITVNVQAIRYFIPL